MENLVGNVTLLQVEFYTEKNDINHNIGNCLKYDSYDRFF